MLEQQGVHLGIDEVVDRDDLDVRGSLDKGLERLAADPAEAVDADAGGHGRILLADGPVAGRQPGLDGRTCEVRPGRADGGTGPRGSSSYDVTV